MFPSADKWKRNKFEKGDFRENSRLTWGCCVGRFSASIWFKDVLQWWVFCIFSSHFLAELRFKEETDNVRYSMLVEWRRDFFLMFFFLILLLFFIFAEAKETECPSRGERQRDSHAERGAQCGAWSHDPGIMTEVKSRVGHSSNQVT